MPVPDVDGEALRLVMRRVPAPVTVVTAATADEMRGITIGSFTSVSLDPPLVSFNVEKRAQMHRLITRAAVFAVHLLTEDQAHLSNHFAIPDMSGEEQFEPLRYRFDAYGSPILEDVMAVLHCSLYALYEAGDHSLIVGEVLVIDDRGKDHPLVYFNRSYRGVGEEVEMNPLSPVKGASTGTP
jgi:flavin reductase (DIM6/NTAB) family NADH-FMN oxidoreductase RutF